MCFLVPLHSQTGVGLERKEMLIKKCLFCEKEFSNKRNNKYFLGEIQFNKRTFCSKKCRWGKRLKDKKCLYCGDIFTNRRKNGIFISDKRFSKSKFCCFQCHSKGQIGKKLLSTTLLKLKKYGKTHSKENSPRWVGDKIKYRGLHHRIARYLGKPKTCEKCKSTGLLGRNIHWSNKSGKYKTEISDWQRLCSICHGKYDKIMREKGR